MGYSAADTAKKHEHILDEAIRLFRERGFSNVTVSEIMKAAGLTHGPFYNHFASKDALMTETLAHELKKALEKLDRTPATKSGKALYADRYLSETHRDQCGTGCAMAALASGVRQEKKPVRDAFTELLKQYLHQLATRFPWRSKRSARGDAIHMFSCLVGATILARAVSDEAFSKEILTETRRRIDD